MRHLTLRRNIFLLAVSWSIPWVLSFSPARAQTEEDAGQRGGTQSSAAMQNGQARDSDDRGEYGREPGHTGEYDEGPAYAEDDVERSDYADSYEDYRDDTRGYGPSQWYDPSDWYDDPEEIDYLDDFYDDFEADSDEDIYDEVDREMFDEDDYNGYNEEFGDYYEDDGLLYDDEEQVYTREAEDDEYFQGLFDVEPYPDFEEGYGPSDRLPYAYGGYEYFTDDWYEQEPEFDSWYLTPGD